MKKLKIFKDLVCSFSVVLILLLNGTVLHAQVTNQVTGCRLQDENRLKETESLTKNNREAELASGDQVEQGGESTTNCNNQGVNLDCCLMMNPATLEDGVEALGEELGVLGKKITLAKNPIATTIATHFSVGNSSSSLRVEAAFSRAREAKSENGWQEAREAAIEASNYWNGIVEEIQEGRNQVAFSEEEATMERDYLVEKAGVAEVKILAAKPCGNTCEEKRDRADEITALIRSKVWPTVSQTMKDFIEHPSEAKMLAVREAATAYATVYVSAAAYFYNFPSTYDAYTSGATYDTASLFADSSAYVSTPVTAYASIYGAISASGFVSTSASAYANAYACAYDYDAVSTTFSDTACAYAYAIAAAYASAYAVATAASSVSASEAFMAVSVADDVIHDTRVVANLSSGNTRAKYYLSWSVSAAREMADFARAVVRYRTEQEAAVARPVPEWKARVERSFVLAKRDRSQKFWRKAEIEAREAIALCQNVEEINCGETTVEKDFWIEMARIAELKALAMSSCDRKSRSVRTERMNAVMKMTREKFGSPVSQAMKEFIAHPNETTLRATGKSFVIAMSSAEAEESLEAVEVFAKASTDAAEFGRRRSMNAATQENLDWCEIMTHDIAEFARAVADFKAAKQP